MKGLVSTPYEPSYSKPVYHLYVVRTPYRGELQEYLTQAGIGTGIHYPIPVHLQKAYASRNWKRGDFPVSEEAADQILSLAMYPSLQPQQQSQVAEAIAEFAQINSVI